MWIQTVGRNIFEGRFKKGKKDGHRKLIYFGEIVMRVISNKKRFKVISIKTSYGRVLTGVLDGHQIGKFNLNDLNQSSQYIRMFKQGYRDGNGHYIWGINMRAISQRGNQMDRGSLNLMVEKIKEPGKMTSK